MCVIIYFFFILSGLRGAPGYSLEQAHHLPIEMDPLIGEHACTENPLNPAGEHASVSAAANVCEHECSRGNSRYNHQITGDFFFLRSCWLEHRVIRKIHDCVAGSPYLGPLLNLLTSLCSRVANNSGVNKRQITDLVDQSIQINTHCFVVTADNRYILACGFWDKSFRVYSTETGAFALASTPED